jgi:glycosyltransferase involved in cell wall biosynthesis
MTVVHVVAAGEIGGAERMLVDLARGNTARPHAIALFTPNDRLRMLFRDAGLDVMDRGGVREGPLPFLKSTLGSSDVRWLIDVLSRRRAEIVHLHTFASQVLGTRAAKSARARIVRTEHSTRVYDDPSCWPFSQWSLKRTDAVVCISDHVRKIARARATFLDETRVSVVHNGVDTTRFAPVDEARVGAAGPVRFVALGRLDPRKGLDLALEALAKVPSASLDIVGEGEEQNALERCARRWGVTERVTFSGHMVDVRAAIARADAILSSAREEGLGIALLEAMAMARPVVAVPIGGIVEIVREGDTGWLADARTAEALARVMQAAVERGEERVRRGALARERVIEHFSVDAMRAGYERIYASVTSSNRGV